MSKSRRANGITTNTRLLPLDSTYLWQEQKLGSVACRKTHGDFLERDKLVDRMYTRYEHSCSIPFLVSPVAK